MCFCSRVFHVFRLIELSSKKPQKTSHSKAVKVNQRILCDLLTLSLLLHGSSKKKSSRLQSPFYPLLCLGVVKQLEGVTGSIKTPVFTIQNNTAGWNPTKHSLPAYICPHTLMFIGHLCCSLCICVWVYACVHWMPVFVRKRKMHIIDLEKNNVVKMF